MNDKKISKFISLLLRHHPEALNLEMDEHGWVSVNDLIRGLNEKYPFTMNDLNRIVENDSKKRYSFNEDRTKIRANQGHSVNVDVELIVEVPPKFLYHGSATRFQTSIEQQGLLPQNRLYVHLSSDIDTAIKVGKRHGKPLIYQIDTQKMIEDGHVFYLSKNQVWLVKHVPFQYMSELKITL